MPIPPDTKLGQYEVRALIGVGGMGEVYRAFDPKLERDVAIKVLPPHFARDPERLARFKREAKLLASLNHDNIATIFGLEESDTTHYLVMEYVPGETLAEQVRRGPVELDETLRIASQIAAALEHAHDKTVVHRDLKPANVKVTPEGKVKVLDFGLAKAFAGDGASGGVGAGPAMPVIDSNSPTLSRMPSGYQAPDVSPTLPGVILGTAAYMSPEQAKGKTVDKRADIWAFGCVVFELLTGKQVFTGESATEILGAIHHKEPDWSALPADTPPAITSLLRRCLQKEATQRYHAAADIRIQIADFLAAPVPAESRVPTLARRTAFRSVLFSGLACLVLGAVLGGLIAWNRRPSPPPQPITRFALNLPPGDRLGAMTALDQPTIAISPDGTHLAYAAGRGGQQQIYLRAMDSLEAKPISGTEGGFNPFFSPDGQWLGFYISGGLRKVSIAGGGPMPLGGTVSTSRGASWGPDNTIVYAANNAAGIFRVSADGGAPEQVTMPQTGDISHRWPQLLPDGKTVLFTILSTGTADDSLIAIQQMGTSERKILLRGGSDARYVPTGHLAYFRAGSIMAVPFDLGRLEVTGTPAVVVEGVQSSTGNTGAGQFSFSNLGPLAYVPGQNIALGGSTPVWVDRKGNAQPLSAPAHNYTNPKLSPDGRLLALVIQDQKTDIWIYDIARDTLTRFTFEGNNTSPNWTPDSKRIIFTSDRTGAQNLFWKLADGSAPEERVTTSDFRHQAGSFTPDGRTLIYTETASKTGQDIWVMPLDGERKPRIYLQTPFNEATGRLSPDGHWLAYVSDESGRYEVYIQPFPGPGAKRQISTDGGIEIAWSPKGNELFYRSEDKMMAVDIQTQPTFVAGKSRILFQGPYVRGSQGAYYSLSPDGQRFLMLQPAQQQTTNLAQINIVLNWFEELKQKVPVK